MYPTSTICINSYCTTEFICHVWPYHGLEFGRVDECKDDANISDLLLLVLVQVVVGSGHDCDMGVLYGRF